MGEQVTSYRRHLPHIEVAGSYYFTTSNTKAREVLSESERSLVLSAILFHRGSKYELDATVVMPDHFHMILQPCEGSDLAEIFHSIKSYSAKQILRNRSVGTAAKVDNEYTEQRSSRSFRTPLTSMRKDKTSKPIVWQDENFDHLIRNERDYLEKLHYLINNPGTAGLLDQAEEYPWLWLRSRDA